MNYGFQAKLASIVNEAEESLIEQYNELHDANQDAADRSFWGGIIGSVGLPLIVGLATGGLGLVPAAILAGVGGRVGREVGEHTEGWKDVMSGGLDELAWREGVTDEGLETQGILSGYQDRLRENFREQWEDFDQQQWVDSGKDALTSFLLGGGMKALKGATKGTLPGVLEAVDMTGADVDVPITITDPTWKDRAKYLWGQDWDLDVSTFIQGLQKGDLTQDNRIDTSSVYITPRGGDNTNYSTVKYDDENLSDLYEDFRTFVS